MPSIEIETDSLAAYWKELEFNKNPTKKNAMLVKLNRLRTSKDKIDGYEYEILLEYYNKNYRPDDVKKALKPVMRIFRVHNSYWSDAGHVYAVVALGFEPVRLDPHNMINDKNRERDSAVAWDASLPKNRRRLERN